VTNPVRVLHVVRPATGGIRQHVLSLLNGLNPAQVVNSLAAPPKFLVGISDCPNLYASIPLKIAAGLSPVFDLRTARRLAGLQPQFSDIVHAHGVRAAWVAALARRRRPFPLLFTAHNMVERSVPARLGISFIGRHCTQVLAVSEAVAGSIAACGVPRAKIKVIPNGIDAEFFRPASNSRAEARAAFSLSDTAFVVAAAARFSPEKGLDTLIQAARQRKNMTFLLAGDGPLRNTFAQDLPSNVKLLGRLDDILPLLAAADVFAMPSRREGQGIAALEAMAAGVPIAASNVGGLAEMLTDGQTALLVPPNDPDVLAAALSRLQSDSRLRQTLAENASALVYAQYGLQPMLDTLTEVYQAAWPS
jgi:glycosyltransferase involved in cell wall biosynthesis